MSESTPETPAAEPQAPAEQNPAPAAAAPESPKPQPPAAGQQSAEPQPSTPSSADELPSWAQRELKKLRDEAAGNRVKAKEVSDALAQFKADQDARQLALAKAMGLATDEPLTPEQLTEQLNATKAERDQQQQRARQTAVELAVFRAAAAEQVDGNALLDSRAFVSALDGLDPSAPDFGQQVKDAIATAASNPRYKLEPAAAAAPEPPAPPSVPKSGAEFGAPPSGPRQWTEEDVAHASPAQLQKAINEGLLENLGFGKRRASRR